MSAVLDASVVVKWFVKDPLTAAARKVRESSRPAIAPSFMTVEVANAFRRYVVRNEMQQDLALDTLDLLPRIVTLVDHRSFLEEATALAIKRNHSVQDCLYIVTALRRGLPLVTADQKLFRKFDGLAGLELRLLDTPA